MPRFLLFAGPTYYPRGGPGDFISAHNTLDEAKAMVPESVGSIRLDRVGWAQIATFDGERMPVVCSAVVPDSYHSGQNLRWTEGSFDP